MAEAFQIIVVGVLAALMLYAGFLAGKNAGERRAYATVADLRQRLAAGRLERESLIERNRRLTQRLEAANLPVSTPGWMR